MNNYMNMHPPPPPINVLATALTIGQQKIDITSSIATTCRIESKWFDFVRPGAATRRNGFVLVGQLYTHIDLLKRFVA